MPDEEPSVIATSDQTTSDQITTNETAQAIAARRQEQPLPEPKPYYRPGRSKRWVPENA